LGVRRLAGRVRSRDHARDNAWTPYEPEEAVEPARKALVQRGINMVVNELAAEQMGFSNPAEAIGKQVRLNQFGLEIGMLPATIVGVVENSRFRSLREPVEAMMMYDRGIYWNVIERDVSHNLKPVRKTITQ